MEREVVNNCFYDELGTQWYEADNHPIALLRAENQVRTPWVAKSIARHFPHKRCTVIDIGCGAGFLSNVLAQHGHYVTGIDLSEKSLEVARQRDVTNTVFYSQADAYALPFSEPKFDVVCAMDFLEHVEKPSKIIEQVSAILKPKGVFFFHTFNRSWFSWLVALKGVEWFVPNTPEHMHLYRLFIKPQELETMLQDNKLAVSQMHGLEPVINKGFWKLIFKRRISKDFQFQISSSLRCGYMGSAIKC